MNWQNSLYLTSLATNIIFGLHLAAASSTPWGGRYAFASYAPTTVENLGQMDYVVQPTSVEGPGPLCVQARAIKCSSQVVNAIDLLKNANGRITTRQILSQLDLENDMKQCVTFFLWRLFRMMYISESMLEWLLEINATGIPVLRSEFIRLFRGKPNARHSSRLPIRPQSSISFEPKRCDLHLWYTEILMQYVDRPLADMVLTVIPDDIAGILPNKNKRSETVIAPSREVILRILDLEKSRISLGIFKKRREDALYEQLSSIDSVIDSKVDNIQLLAELDDSEKVEEYDMIDNYPPDEEVSFEPIVVLHRANYDY